MSRLPSRELRRFAKRVETALDLLASARGIRAWPRVMEAPLHAWLLSNLALRNAEAVCTLAAADVNLLPAAWTNTRAALEASIRGQWMLRPDDPMDREARWLWLLNEGVGARESFAISDDGVDARRVEEASSVAKFIADVRALLPAGTDIPKKRVSLKEMAPPEWYARYRLASQYVHSTDVAAGHYRRNLGTDKHLGEFIHEYEWGPPLNLSWIATRELMLVANRSVGVDLGVDLRLLNRQVEEGLTSLFSALGRPNTPNEH